MMMTCQQITDHLISDVGMSHFLVLLLVDQLVQSVGTQTTVTLTNIILVKSNISVRPHLVILGGQVNVVVGEDVLVVVDVLQGEESCWEAGLGSE